MESIRQKPGHLLQSGRLPDFRNLGVVLRLLLLVNVFAAITVLLQVEAPSAWPLALVTMAGQLELPLFLVVLVLYLGQPALARLRRPAGIAALFSIVLTAVALTFPLLADAERDGLWRWLAWAAVATVLTLLYYDYHGRRYSPALTEARLMALTARIRPHFLFNSLNGVLGVIRSDPRRAEQALEELADLFRALMRDNRDLVPLGDELDLCARYLSLEQLRLGERLHVNWSLDDCPRDALVPPLMLQPLLENAVYHGVEPSSEQAQIEVRVARKGSEVRIEVDNPEAKHVRHDGGNRMALENIRERLMLFYDLEAALVTESGNGRHRVSIRLPYRRRKAP